MLEKFLIIAVLLLYLKWIFIICFYPLMVGWRLYQNKKTNKFYKLLAVPADIIERILRFGGGGDF